jgi:hypothetical protein
MMKKGISEKEKRITELAKIAWNKALQDFYYPPLNEPNFLFDYTRREGFYIDPERWQITMNLAATPIFTKNQEYIKYFFAISLHEISHYQIIPYDGLINAKLLRAAMKHVSENFAAIIVNIFADIIIDTKLFQKYPEIMLWELKKTYQNISKNYKDKISDFSRFLFLIYEKMWNIEIIKDKESSEVDDLVNNVYKIILKDFENDTLWESKVNKIAYCLKGLISNTFNIIGVNKIPGKNKSKRRAPNGERVIMPNDILEIMDNPLENKNSDKLHKDNEDELREKAEQFARDVPYSEFGAPAGQAGLLIDAYPLATWYRALAKDLIEIKIYEEKPGGELPTYPEIWRIGDPLEELDVVQSLLSSPVLIPNITTRKWTYKEGQGHLVELSIPDLLIVLDSSGSMNWNYKNNTKENKSPYHIALIASFASLHYAASKGVKFSVINFSNRGDICPWTNDFNKAEHTLLRYQGGGTVLPIKEIVNQCENSEKKTLIFIITDFGIYNWSSTKKVLIDLSEKGHKVIGFFIGTSDIPRNKFKGLLDKVTFYPVKEVKNLINLVIYEVKRNYS